MARRFGRKPAHEDAGDGETDAALDRARAAANAAGDRATDLAGAGIVVGAEAMGKAKRLGAQVMGDERVQSGVASLARIGASAKRTASKMAADARARIDTLDEGGPRRAWEASEAREELDGDHEELNSNARRAEMRSMANAAGDRATDLAGAGIVVGAEAMGKAKRFGAQVMGDERVQSGLASLTKFGNKAKQTAGKIAADAKARARLDEPSDVSLSWPTRQAPSPSEGRGDPADGGTAAVALPTRQAPSHAWEAKAGGLRTPPPISSRSDSERAAARGAQGSGTDGRMAHGGGQQRGAADSATRLPELQPDVATDPRASLLYASTMGDATALGEALALGADPDAQDEGGQTALHYACEGGHLEVLRLLVLQGAELDVANQNDASPLHTACIKGHAACTSVLLRAGAAVDPRAGNGGTPLHAACLGGHARCVEGLIDARADVNAADTTGATPLQCACILGFAPCVELL